MIMDASLLPEFKTLAHSAQWDLDGADAISDQQSSPPTLTTDRNTTLNADSSWTYCGPLLPLDARDLPSSFHTWARATVKGSIVIPLFSFLRFVHQFLTANEISNYWLTIRASQGSHEFDIPRWHTDDLFFSPGPGDLNGAESRLKSRSLTQFHRPRSRLPSLPNEIRLHKRTTSSSSSSSSSSTSLASFTRFYKDLKSPTVNYQTNTQAQLPPFVQITSSIPNPANWKLTTTLLGPGTLFIAPHLNTHARTLQRTTKMTVRAENPDHICLSIRCVGCASAAESVRATLAAQLGGHCHGHGDDNRTEDMVQARQGEYVFFRVGEDEGAVHSEPMSHGDRIFVNVVPGCEEDLRRLMAKWGMEYPRAWCLGLLLQGVEEGCWRNVGEA